MYSYETVETIQQGADEKGRRGAGHYRIGTLAGQLNRYLNVVFLGASFYKKIYINCVARRRQICFVNCIFSFEIKWENNVCWCGGWRVNGFGRFQLMMCCLAPGCWRVEI